MAKDNDRFDPSWFLVIIMLGVFWPVGLYFLWSKLQCMNEDNAGEARAEARKKSDKKIRGGLSLGGIILMAIGFLMFTNGAKFGLFLAIGGGMTAFMKWNKKAKASRMKRYKAIIGSKNVMTIAQIASTLQVDEDQCRRELQDAIDEGAFGQNAYIDYGRALFIRDSMFAPREEAPAREARRQEQPKREAVAPKPATNLAPKRAQASDPAYPGLPDEYAKKLRAIRKANDDIADEKMSAQISRIEATTHSIFTIVSKHPEKKTEIATFMNYYLPTTLKLLDSYAELEKQNVHGTNIETSRHNIEDLMEKVVWAFDQQLDRVFSKSALDISSDISVMETMMAKDGLSSGKLPQDPFGALRAGGGH